ncbi:MAG TPA: tyrosine--tRNA ligase [Bacteroidales bacterium]|nr:tyrosine--tRNA ligase [Bacteroidales bacterium]
MNFVEELKWRGMIHNMMPGTEEQLAKEMTVGYIGFDPTAESLHVGSFAQILLLKRFQLAGHKPIALIGGATGMIGDPSGKSQERNLLDEEMLQHNLNGIKRQLSKFLDFESGKPNSAVMVNNYDWMKGYDFLGFIRDVGKHISVNYMMSKDSVKKRLGDEAKEGMSFTEFSYQLVQGYDFLWLYQNMNCKLQMGGSDQWGNITTGTELIRRKLGGEAFALTIPLITKTDGTKFGKTENGNVWLDAHLTSPYKFYQFWLNTSDEDAERYIKIFTLLDKNTIESLIAEHKNEPHLRKLQKTLAREITVMVHSDEDYRKAVEASEMLFGNATTDMLNRMDEDTFLSVFEGVPTFEVKKSELAKGIPFSILAAEITKVFPSKGELRRMVQGGGLSINKQKIDNADITITTNSLLNGKYILVQKGKKNYSIILAVD